MYGFTGGNAPRDAAIHAPYAQPPQRAEGRPSSVRGGHARIARARYGAPLPLVLVSPALLAPAVDTLARDHFEPSMSTLAGGDTVECREAAILDLDGDGYAECFAHGSDRDEVSTTDELPLTCPAG